MSHHVEIRSRSGNVALGVVGAIYFLSAIGTLLLYVITSWGAAALIDHLLQLTLIGSAVAGAELSADFPKLNELERRYVARVLAFTGGNMSKAARILGIDRKTLYRMRESLSQNAPDVENWDIH